MDVIKEELNNLSKERLQQMCKQVEFVYQQGSCIRCAMRFLRYSTPMQLFNQEERALVDLFHSYSSEITLEYPKKIICTLCYGILQNQPDDPSKLYYQDQLLHSIKTCDYQYDDFQFCVSVPHSIVIRDACIQKQLAETFSDSFRENDSLIPTIKEVFKWKYSLLIPIRFKNESQFTITLAFQHNETNAEVEKFKAMSEKQKRNAKRSHRSKSKKNDNQTNFSIPDLINQLKSKNLSDLQSMNLIPLQPIKEPSELNVTYEHGYVYVAGRYNKYSRVLSQTPWVIDGVRKTPDSVEELIGNPFVSLFNGTGCTFSSSGREDVDVRMLGTGRPFILEIHNPRKAKTPDIDVVELEKTINQSTKLIQVRDCQIIPKEETEKIKEGEEHKRKVYRCVVCTSKPVSIQVLDKFKEQPFEIDQLTPLRVLHRRTLATRKKMIYRLTYEMINPQYFLIDLETQAGTYIKEFIHGDFGRTQPNLGSLLECTADILQLDVHSIVFDWPPPRK